MLLVRYPLGAVGEGPGWPGWREWDVRVVSGSGGRGEVLAVCDVVIFKVYKRISKGAELVDGSAAYGRCRVSQRWRFGGTWVWSSRLDLELVLSSDSRDAKIRTYAAKYGETVDVFLASFVAAGV